MKGKPMELTVYDLCNLYVEGRDIMVIWCEYAAEHDGDGIVFEGTFNQAIRSDWAECKVESFGIEEGTLVVNVA